MADDSTTSADDQPLEADASGSTLFPRLTPEQYKSRLLRYVYILMRLIFLALFVLVIWWLGGALGSLFVPLAISFILAYLVDPLVDRLENHGMHRRVAILICLLAVVVLFGLVIAFLVPSMVQQIGQLISQLPELIKTVQNEWIPWVEQHFRTDIPESVQQSIQRSGGQVTSALPKAVTNAGQWALGAVVTTSQVLFTLFNLVLIPIFTYYFLRKIDAIKHSVGRWLPVRRREYTLELLGRMDRAVGQWFRGQVWVAVVVGIIYSVGLAIAFGLAGIDIKLGIAIGLIAGITNVIPYIGMIVAVVLTTVVVLLNWPGWTGVLGVVIVFAINHVIEAYVAAPNIIGDKVSMNPVAVIILLLAGSELAGLWGALLIVPIAGAIKVIIPDLMEIYRQSAFYHGGEVVNEKD